MIHFQAWRWKKSDPLPPGGTLEADQGRSSMKAADQSAGTDLQPEVIQQLNLLKYCPCTGLIMHLISGAV